MPCSDGSTAPTDSPRLQYTSSFKHGPLSRAPVRAFRQRYTPTWLQNQDKNWLKQARTKDQVMARYIVYLGMLVGLLSAVLIVLVEYLHSNRASYVLVMHDNFSSQEIRSDFWQHEQRLDGFVENSFDVTTASAENSWLANGTLHIRPTIGSIHAEGQELDLTARGICTSATRSHCYALQNTTASSAIPNVQTARLRSRASITYGKVEVIAKLPKGDWIFSTIGLDPQDLLYGQFPASGQIDIMQTRGNGDSFVSGGRNRVDTILHFGADGQPYSDCASLARTSFTLPQTDFSSRFHTFGLEWTPKMIRTWIDYPSNTFMEVKIGQGFWRKAAYAKRFPNDINYKSLANPWTNGSISAPYDMPFHLTLRANVGSVTGIFAEDSSKPWYDAAGRGASMIAMQNNGTWESSWGSDEDHTMYIKDVKMWQQVM